MNVFFAEHFLKKFAIDKYAFRGFFARFTNFNNTTPIGNQLQNTGQTTTYFNVNTFIYEKDNIIRLSFKFPWENNNDYNTIVVYALDSISSIDDIIPNIDEIEVDIQKYKDYVAFVITSLDNSMILDIDNPMEEDDLTVKLIASNPEVVNIIDIVIPKDLTGDYNNYSIKASMIPYCQDKFGSYLDLEDNLIYHYNSQNIGKILPSDPTLKTDNLIDKQVGLSRLRETLTYTKDIDLNGSMTIKKSGLIQL